MGISSSKLAAVGYNNHRSNVNFIRRCTPNNKDKKKSTITNFRSVDQPKKRNSIDYTDGLNVYTKNIVKKLDFSPANSNKSTAAAQIAATSKSTNSSKVQEKCLSKRFLIECFNNDSIIYRLYNNNNDDDELTLMEKKYQKIYEKCWQQNPVDRPNSKQLLNIMLNLLKNL